MAGKKKTARVGPPKGPRGLINKVEGARVHGWAHDPMADGSQTVVEFLVNGEIIGSQIASVQRLPLVEKGFPPNCGFAVTLSLPPGTHMVSARTKQSGFELKGSPFKCTMAPTKGIPAKETIEVGLPPTSSDEAKPQVVGLAPAASDTAGKKKTARAGSPKGPRGLINKVEGARIKGWAHDPMADGSQTVVEFFLNGEIIGSEIASVQRLPLVEKGFPPNCGFSVTLPLPPGTHTISVRTKQSGFELKNSPCKCTIAPPKDVLPARP